MRHASERPDQIGRFSFLISPFHSQQITGIQTCLKRQILVTTSLDKSLRVWQYSTSNTNIMKLVIWHNIRDEVLAVALHTTGNYFVASFYTCIRFFNIFPKEIEEYHQLKVQGSTELKFNSFGSLLAVQKGNSVLVYNFFTGVLHENYVFTFHKAHVKSISWLEDDSGFVSTAADSSIAVWRLPRLMASVPGEKHVNRPVWTYEAELTRVPKELNPLKGMEERALARVTKANFTATVPFHITKEKDKDAKEKDHTVKIGVFAAGTDGAIHELQDGKLRTKCDNECIF